MVIEREGIARARQRAAVADVALLLVDLEAALADRSALDAVDALFDSRAVLLLTKVDRCVPAAVDRLCQELQDGRPLPLSVKTGQGLEALLADRKSVV